MKTLEQLLKEAQEEAKQQPAKSYTYRISFTNRSREKTSY